MISTVIVTLNEEKNLKECLSSINNKADEIVIVDLGSSDETIPIAKKYGAKIYFHHKVDYVELVRDFAVSKTNGDWVLVLDPDERTTLTLWKTLKEIVQKEKYIAVNIPRKNIFFGSWIAHTNWWPDRHIRFFKKGKVRWNEKIHSYPKVEGKILQLSADPDLAILHFGYDNLNQFIDRQNKYSKIEAEQLFGKGERFSWINFIWKPTREFLTRYVKHQGYLDGFHGFSLTFLMCIYKLMVEIKLWELSHKKK